MLSRFFSPPLIPGMKSLPIFVLRARDRPSEFTVCSTRSWTSSSLVLLLPKTLARAATHKVSLTVKVGK